MNMFDKKRDSATFNNRPPEIINVLAGILNRYIKRNRMPMDFPPKPFEAARLWINLQESADDYRERVEAIKNDGEVIGWKSPYHDRLSYTLRAFLSLSEPQRTYVLTHMEAGIPWRGDEIDMYAKIIQETEKIRGDTKNYIQNTIQEMKRLRFSL